MLYHVELPEAFLDSVQNVFTATYCCLGAGYVLAGKVCSARPKRAVRIKVGGCDNLSVDAGCR